jgi:hypothetical protein
MSYLFNKVLTFQFKELISTTVFLVQIFLFFFYFQIFPKLFKIEITFSLEAAKKNFNLDLTFKYLN